MEKKKYKNNKRSGPLLFNFLSAVKFLLKENYCFNEKDTRIAWVKVRDTYSLTYRRYHGKSHIQDMLKGYLGFVEKMRYENIPFTQLMFHVGILTIYLHDICRYPKDSAIEAKKILLPLGVNKDAVKLICRMVEETDHMKEKAPVVKNTIEKLITCLDLKPLAINHQRFLSNTQKLWEEHKFLHQDKTCDENKSDFIASCYGLFSILLNHKKIFPLDDFYKKYEKRARKNMKLFMNQEIDDLKRFLL